VTTPRTVPPSAAPAGKPELTHGCARCGAQVPLDVGLCERCNPLGLRDSSSSQVHGIAIGGIIAFVIILAVVGRLALAGIGPFDGTVAGAEADAAASGLRVTLTVTNKGSSTGQTTCHITDPADRTGNTGAFMLSPKIDPKESVTFTQTITGLGTTVRPLRAECSAP
jgi:hypothetical protein